ncbi:MAG: ankyrin repeat domain-containing protein [Bacteroidota bacterium]
MKASTIPTNYAYLAPLFLFLFILGISSCSSEQNPEQSQASVEATMSIHEAIFFGNLKQLEANIAAGTDLNQKDQFGSAPLHVAATFDKAEVALRLIEAGADLNVLNGEGSTPLHLAAFFCRTEITEALLKEGADVSMRNNYQTTALESVQAPFAEVKPIYDELGKALGPMGLKLDYSRLEQTRPIIADLIQSKQTK